MRKMKIKADEIITAKQIILKDLNELVDLKMPPAINGLSNFKRSFTSWVGQSLFFPMSYSKTGVVNFDNVISKSGNLSRSQRK
jgi:hypothetical protein